MGALVDVVRRQRWWALCGLLAPLLLVLVALLVGDKTFESTGTAVVDTEQLGRPLSEDRLPRNRAQVLAPLVAHLDSDPYREVVDEALPLDHDYEVFADPASSRLVVRATGPSAREAQATASAVLFLLVSQQPEVVEVDGLPTLPTDPASPDLAAAVLLALLVGIAVALVAAVGAERVRTRRDAAAEAEAEPGDDAGAGSGRTVSSPHPALETLALVGVAVLAWAALAGVQDLWASRPSDDRGGLAQYDCAERFLEGVPAGSVMVADPEGEDLFWVVALHAAGYPDVRAVLPPDREQADVLVDVVRDYGDEDSCAGFRVEVTDR
jgi:hypothetical protein